MSWKQYQEDVGEFFRSLGCEVAVDATVDGVRGRHKVDVWVQFRKFGLATRWLIECKYWQTAVSKEKVLALKAILDDVGADRGLLLSAKGFQSGAVRVATKTNITLTDLNELQETAQGDLQFALLHRLEKRKVELAHALFDLSHPSHIRPEDNVYWESTPGIDFRAVMGAIGGLSILQTGFDSVRLNNSPFLVRFDETNGRVVAHSLEEFVGKASEVLSNVEKTLVAQQAALRK